MTETSIRLIEIFASVQGETSFVGLPTTFIRLAACNLRCSWCDTTYSFGRGDLWTQEEILSRVKELKCQTICITGGEPLLQQAVYSLMKKLCDLGYQLSVETGGSLLINQIDPRVTCILDIKCPASLMSDKNEWNNIQLLRPHDEVKFVLANFDDYTYAKAICEQYHLSQKVKHILFSPVHDVLDNQLLVSWILKDALPVRLNLQIHKFVWDPLTKGV